jgi:hypothetical protein
MNLTPGAEVNDVIRISKRHESGEPRLPFLPATAIDVTLCATGKESVAGIETNAQDFKATLFEKAMQVSKERPNRSLKQNNPWFFLARRDRIQRTQCRSGACYHNSLLPQTY